MKLPSNKGQISDEIAKILFVIAGGLLLIALVAVPFKQWVETRTSEDLCGLTVLASQEATVFGEKNVGLNCPKDFPLTIEISNIEKTRKFSQEENLKRIYAEKMRTCWTKMTRFYTPGSTEFRKLFDSGVCILCTEIKTSEEVKNTFENGILTGFDTYLQTTSMLDSSLTYNDFLYDDYAQSSFEDTKEKNDFLKYTAIENINNINLDKQNIVMFIKEPNSKHLAVKLLELGKTDSCKGKTIINQPPVTYT